MILNLIKQMLALLLITAFYYSVGLTADPQPVSAAGLLVTNSFFATFTAATLRGYRHASYLLTKAAVKLMSLHQFH